MKKSHLLLYILFFIIAVSCEKDGDVIVSPNTEQTLSQAEINAQILQTYIDESRPAMAAAFRLNYEQNDWINDNNGTSCSGFKIESPYIQICGVYYNLEYLVKYEPGNTLKLYFKY